MGFAFNLLGVLICLLVLFLLLIASYHLHLGRQYQVMCAVLKSFHDFQRLLLVRKIEFVCLFIGNGPKLQYQDLDAVKLKVSEAIEKTLNPIAKYGDRIENSDHTWLALYGGDTFVEDKPDLGSVIHFVKQKYNPILVSVQCWDELDSHVDYVWKYPKVVTDGRVVYGGFNEMGNPVGGTDIYLGNEVMKLLNAVFNVDARGRVGSQEKEYALGKKLNVVHIDALPKNAT